MRAGLAGGGGLSQRFDTMGRDQRDRVSGSNRGIVNKFSVGMQTKDFFVLVYGVGLAERADIRATQRFIS